MKILALVMSVTLTSLFAASAQAQSSKCAIYEINVPYATTGNPVFRPDLDSQSMQEFNANILPLILKKGFTIASDQDKKALTPDSNTVAYSLTMIVYHPFSTAGYKVEFDLSLNQKDLAQTVVSITSLGQLTGSPYVLSYADYADTLAWIDKNFPTCTQAEAARVANGVKVDNGGDRISVTGAVFHQVADPNLGEAYEDPSGLRWRAVTTSRQWQNYASGTCARLGGGARLPSEDEYRQLSQYLGYDMRMGKGIFNIMATNHPAQVVPNLGLPSTPMSSMKPWAPASSLYNNLWTSQKNDDGSGSIFQFGDIDTAPGIQSWSTDRGWNFKCVRRSGAKS